MTSAPALFSMVDVAARLGKSRRWLQDFLKNRPYGRMAGRSRLFTESDYFELLQALSGEAPTPRPRQMSKDMAALKELCDSKNQNRAGLIYVVKDDHERVKIGFALSDVEWRVATLQCGNADPLIIEVIFEGPESLERELHRKFHKYHVRGEWFVYSEEIRSFVAAKSDGAQ